MSWECRYLYKDYCRKRGKDCVPGEPGCVLYGKYEFPFAGKTGTDERSKEKQKKNPKLDTGTV